MCVPEQKLAEQPQQQYRLPPREYGGTWQHSASLRRPEPSVSCPGTISGILQTCRFLCGGVPPGSNSAAYPGLVDTGPGVFEDAGYARSAKWTQERHYEFPGINAQAKN
jgi:hypothetical protein